MSIALQHTRQTPRVSERHAFRPRRSFCREGDRGHDPQVQHLASESPTAPEEIVDDLLNEDGADKRADLDDLIGVLDEVLFQPPYDVSPPAYLELNLVVGTILGEKYPDERTAGRIRAARVYDRLSGPAATEIDPDEGGIGITNLANCPSTLVNQTEKYKKSAYKVGPKTVDALDAFGHFNGTAGQVTKATKYLHRTGDVGPLEFLLSPTGTAPDTDAGADRRAIEVKTSETNAWVGNPSQSRINGHTGELTGDVGAIWCSTRVSSVHGGGGIDGESSGGPDDTSKGNPSKGDPRDRRELDALSEETIQRLMDRRPLGTVPRLALSKEPREASVEWRPVLDESRPLMAMHQHLLFSGMRDVDWTYSGDCTGVVFSAGVVLGCFGYHSRQHLHEDTGANTGQLFDIYRREVAPLSLTGWNGKRGKGRVVKSHGIPDRIIRRAKEAKLSPGEEQRWFISGKDTRSDGKDVAEIRDERSERAGAQEPLIEPPEATSRMQSYLNGLDQQRFSHGAHGVFNGDKLEEARQVARSVGARDSRRDRGLEKLFWIGTYPQPTYLFCDRFPRLKADHHNQAMNLPTPIRRSVYTARDRELDLSKAHLASYVPVARREGIGVPVLERYLEANLEDDEELLEEGDLWTELASTIRCPAFNDAKALRGAVKRAYSIVYGKEKRGLPYQILKEYCRLTGYFHGTTAPIKPLLSHPLMEEILQTRDQLSAIINDQKGLKDANGRVIRLSAWNETKKKENRWRGVLAYVNATYEQELMGAAFDVARQEMERSGNTRFWIWLYQADGFTMRVRSDASATRQIERLQDAVGEEAGVLDVPTELDVDYPREE
jgi:hypothetical protein